MNIVGIDPGKNGGLSSFKDGELVEFIVMPTYLTEKVKGTKQKEMVDFIAVGKFIKKHNPNFVYIERVGAMPGNGGVSMFGFGFSTGGLHGVCGALEIPVKIVGPRAWQKELMGEDTHEKSDTINFVQFKWPDISLLATKRSKKPHDGLADAIAIGWFGVLNISKSV